MRRASRRVMASHDGTIFQEDQSIYAMMKKILLTMCLAWSGIQPAWAAGELMVMPASMKVFHGHDYSVTLSNVGDGPLYLSVSLQQVTNPGLTPENKVVITEVARPGLLASPERVTLGAGQSRKVLIKSLHEPTVEGLYRLYIVPVRATTVEDAPTDKITAPVTVSIAYGVLLRHLPPVAKQVEDWSRRCEGGSIVLESTGNVRKLLSDVSSDKQSVPTALGLYPGTPQRIEGTRLNWVEDGKPQSSDCRG